MVALDGAVHGQFGGIHCHFSCSSLRGQGKPRCSQADGWLLRFRHRIPLRAGKTGRRLETSMLAFAVARKEIKSTKSRPFYFSLRWASPMSPIKLQPSAPVLARDGVTLRSQFLKRFLALGSEEPLRTSTKRGFQQASLAVHPRHRGRNLVSTANTSPRRSAAFLLPGAGGL